MAKFFVMGNYTAKAFQGFLANPDTDRGAAINAICKAVGAKVLNYDIDIGMIEGEIQQLEPDYPVTELWQVLAQRASGRTHTDQITLFDSVGFAIEDFSASKFVRSAALQQGTYSMLDLVADPDDPRDLFGMLGRAKFPRLLNTPI